jgi:KipI family sensor histidine kinase inhibitor
MRFLNAGSNAMIVELDDLDEVMAAYGKVRRALPVGVIELVPAARTILARFDSALTTASRLSVQFIELASEKTSESASVEFDEVEVPVVYDGPDLAAVADLTGLSVKEVVARHQSGAYTVAFCGFAPGFAYMTGLDPVLWLPRRPVPRTRVPVGSVAISDRFTSVYPSMSPGGWHLLGHTKEKMWDIARPRPALLMPGMRARFVEVDS